MPAVLWPHCVGQYRIKEVLSAAYAKNTVGHAYLFSGQTGLGTFAAALDLALILLCEKKEPRPCLTCASCKKVLHYSFPDFHIIMPVVLGKEHKNDKGELAPEGWDYIASCVKERIADPYRVLDHSKTPTLPVDWIREVNQTVKRGAVEGSVNVVILDGIDLMNKEAANSMLKLLEEPPPGTVMLLLTDRLPAVLPTIVSRCQILRFAYLSPQEIKTELCRRYAADPSDERLETVAAAGNLGEALERWGMQRDASGNEAVRFWDLCRSGDWGAIAAFIDEASQWADISRYERMFLELMERVRNAFLCELPGTENVFLGSRSRVVTIDGAFSRERFETTIGICQKAIGAIKAHAAVALVLAQCAIALSKELHGKERQAG